MLRLLRHSSRETDDQAADDRLLPCTVLEFESPAAAIIARPVPPLSRITTLLVFLLVVSTLLAGALIRIDKIVSATGKLVAQAPNIILQPFGESIVASIYVREGDIVRKGQVLARLNPTFAAADLATIKNQVDSLSAKARRLEAETTGTTYIPDPANPLSALQASIFNQQVGEYRSSVRTYDQKIAQLQTKIAGHKSQEDIYRERLGIASHLEEVRQGLENQQFGSKLATLAAKDSRLNIAAARAQAESDAAQAGGEMAAERAERDAYVQRWNGANSQELADTRSKLVQAQQDWAKASLQSKLMVLTAPVDAVVLSVDKISVGSVVTSAAPLIQLVPVDAPLLAQVDISGIDSGYVRPGDKVGIKFDTLPFLQYGSARGVVRTISADSFSPETPPQQGGSTLPNGPRTLYYRGNVSLEQIALHDTPPGFRLVPGMPLTADVKVGTRSVLGYFVSKILPIAHDSMHEP